MSDTRKARLALKQLYPSKSYSKKIDSMSNAQVMAIYQRLKQAKKI